MSQTIATLSNNAGILSYQEFLAQAPDGSHLEWVDGKVVEMTPVSNAHADVANFLSGVLTILVRSQRLGRLFQEPFQMKTGDTLSGRSPDIMFVSTEHLGQIRDNYLEGPADAAIEIVSPGSRTIDHGEKFYEYEQGGVKEYWILDPHRKRAEFFHLDAEGLYAAMPLDAQGLFHSREIAGCWFKPEQLWPGQMPPILDVLRDWKVI